MQTIYSIFLIVLVLFSCTKLTNQVRPTVMECGEDFAATDQFWFQAESASGALLAKQDIEVFEVPFGDQDLVHQDISSKGCFHLPPEREWIIRSKVTNESRLIAARQRTGIDRHRIRLEANGHDRTKLLCPSRPLNAPGFTWDQLVKVDDLTSERVQLDFTISESISGSRIYQSKLVLNNESLNLLSKNLADGAYHVTIQVKDLRRAQNRQHECEVELDSTPPIVDLDRSHLTRETENLRDIYVIPRQEQLRFVSLEIASDSVKVDYCFQPIAETENNLGSKRICPWEDLKTASPGEPVAPLLNSGAWLLQFSAVDAAGNRSSWQHVGPIVYVDSSIMQQIHLESRSDMIQTEIVRQTGIFDVLHKAFKNFAAWKSLTTAFERQKTKDAILSFFYAVHIGMNNYARFLGLNERSNKLVMTKDGGRWIVGVYHGDVQIIDVKNRKVEKVLRGHTSNISSLALSDDDKLLLTGSFDQTIRLWELDSGHLLTTIPCCEGEFILASFSTDNQFIISTSWDKFLKIWKLDGSLQRTITLESEPQFHNDVIMAIKSSSDGRYFATASWDRTVRLWDFNGNFVRKMQTDHLDGVNDIAFTADSRALISVGKDGQILLHNVEDGSLQKKLAVLPAGITAMALSNDKLVVGSLDNAIRVFNPSNGQMMEGPLKVEVFGMDSVAIDSAASYFVATTNSTVIRMWGSGGQGSFVNAFAGHNTNSSVRTLALDEANQKLFSAGTDRQIMGWDLVGLKKEWSVVEAQDTIYDLKISPEREFLYAASKDGRLRRYSLPHPSPGEVVLEHENEWLFSIDFDPITSQAYLGTWNGLILIPKGPDQVGIETGSYQGWTKVLFEPTRRQLLTLNRDWYLRALDAESLKELKRLRYDEALISGKVSPDGRSVFVGLWNGKVSSVDLESFTENYQFDAEGGIVWDVWYDQNTGYLVTATNDGRIRVWNSSEKKLLGVPLQVSNKALRSLVYDSGKGVIITGDDDGLVKVWNVPLTQDVGVLKTLVCEEAGEVLRAPWFEDRYNFSLGSLCN